MTLELINPEGLPTPASYTQVIVATGSRLVFVAGQVADDAQGNPAGTGDWLTRPGRPSPTSAAPSPQLEPDRSR